MQVQKNSTNAVSPRNTLNPDMYRWEEPAGSEPHVKTPIPLSVKSEIVLQKDTNTIEHQNITNQKTVFQFLSIDKEREKLFVVLIF